MRISAITERPLEKLFLVVSLAVLVLSALPAAAEDARALVTGRTFDTVLPPATGLKQATVATFRLDRTPVTNAEFARFLRTHAEWRRDRVAKVFADDGYLNHWPTAVASAADTAEQPVTHVSWFAASAYCSAQGARLPTWYEWEWVAAASRTEADARKDPQWRQKILDWYSRSASQGLPKVGLTQANLYGVYDVHGVIWEWVEDLSGMLVSGDNREQGDPDKLRFCGTGALTMEQKENYAMLMRIAMLSSMQARYTSATMGFRCAVDGR
jgi:formylglycine-generating enzyme required for sulfatase activity